MVEEEDSHLFNIFDFAEQIGDWDMSINNSVNFLWANLTNETQQRQQQTNIIIPRGGPVQGIIGQALNDNGLLGLNFHSGIVYDQPTNQRHCWGLYLDPKDAEKPHLKISLGALSEIKTPWTPS